ncbi:hypothetical protein EO213_05820 [Paracoccus denitrificans]|jgi:hypothetical protein|uniref:Uncharacterized protein n=1 Tax=Paracoccus denitrificans (strain Pd 1222) TaxID=318586 RepID=A1B4S1_PARDP|nr:hypothetical protein Pden_2428 [Paracoccus denitrificans PD1222]QAR25853.1 hypothetical protein EO213_05820 [Paracoccus denitrificans]SDI46744.1 hypothetical protein SAMN04244581_01639 [Paracoccus denitrificans]SFR03165.1 hypothetical protein SAMN04244569_01449 [Paracoccus denitrificans]
MSRAGASLLILAVLVFTASTLLYALRSEPAALPLAEPGLALSPWQGYPGARPPPVDLPGLFLRPEGLGMAGLLGMTWAALAYHAGRRWFERRRMRLARAAALEEERELPPQNAGPPTPGHLLRLHERDDSLGEHAPLILGLLAGAIWPWFLRGHPVIAFLLSAAMLAGFLAAALRGIRAGSLVQHSSSLGFVAGWGLLVSFAVFTGLLRDRLGVPQEAAAVIALLIGSVAAVSVQLRLGRRIGFSVAVIWGLIGIAASTVTTDAAIATMTVIAIAIIAVALVRVTT